ncbi:MAG: hypothetical protein ACOZIN_19680 [Myxococcota bacterium]
MHRTTINLDEAIYRKVLNLAKRQGKSLARTIEQLLRESLPGEHAVGRISAPLHRENGPLPGVDIADRDRLYELMDGR